MCIAIIRLLNCDVINFEINMKFSRYPLDTGRKLIVSNMFSRCWSYFQNTSFQAFL